MSSESSRVEARSWSRKPILVGSALLLILSARCGRPPAGAPSKSDFLREVRVQGRRLGPGMLPPPRSEEEEQDGGSERERLARWIESRHRAAPGVDWSVIEAANLRAARARLTAKARGPQPVWHERGPINMTGATAFTALRPDGRTLLVASLSGGIFSGTPGGKGWTRLTDSLGELIQGFVVSWPPETWVTALESRNGILVYVSRDHGATWSPPRGLPPLYRVYELLQDGGDRRTIYLLGASAGEDGLLPVLARSRDGGLSFTEVYRGASAEQPGLWTSRTGPGPLYLMSHGRLLVSTDHGSSFSPLGQIGREIDAVVLRGSEAGAPTFYAAVGTGYPSELFASEDGGRTWEKRFSSSGLMLLGSSLVASPKNPDLVLFGFVDGWRSIDGGRNFTQINDWSDYYGDPAHKLHADLRGLQFLPYRGQETLFLPTDGGTYMSTDGGASVSNITLKGLINAQIYGTWSSASNPDLFLAGSQDQGLQQTIPPRGGRAGAPLSTVQRISGDYGNLTSASHDLANVFAFYPGYLLLLYPGGDSTSILFVPLPPMTSGSFFATAAADPDDPSTVYVAGDHIWKVRYLGGEDFARTQLPQGFSPDGRDYVSALAIAPADHDLWYASTFEGHLWYSRDHGATWTESVITSDSRPNNSISALLISTDDPFTCFAGGSGYGSPPIVVTHDGGVHWSPLSDGLPSTLVWSFAFDSPATQTLYAATEAGPFVLDTASATWRSLLGGASPVLPYFSIEGVPSAHLIRFGTFGRGVWDYVPPRRPQ
jgi:photosystem II stability/assembly factor-like uncharacterized protein